MSKLQIEWHISGHASAEEFARGREILCHLLVERVLKKRGIMPNASCRGHMPVDESGEGDSPSKAPHF